MLRAGDFGFDLTAFAFGDAGGLAGDLAAAAARPRLLLRDRPRAGDAAGAGDSPRERLELRVPFAGDFDFDFALLFFTAFALAAGFFAGLFGLGAGDAARAGDLATARTGDLATAGLAFAGDLPRTGDLGFVLVLAAAAAASVLLAKTDRCGVLERPSRSRRPGFKSASTSFCRGLRDISFDLTYLHATKTPKPGTSQSPHAATAAISLETPQSTA